MTQLVCRECGGDVLDYLTAEKRVYRHAVRGIEHGPLPVEVPALPEVRAGFWDRVDRSGGPDACWPWMGYRNRKGYGTVSVRGHGTKAHRAVLRALVGDLGDRLALHICDNPPCCNPTHLYAGTVSDNSRDMVARGRVPRQMQRWTECRNGHPMAGDNVLIDSDGSRRCRSCDRARTEATTKTPEYRARMRAWKRASRERLQRSRSAPDSTSPPDVAGHPTNASVVRGAPRRSEPAAFPVRA